jgi:F-type H+-transporting ATPase subunit epsilon
VNTFAVQLLAADRGERVDGVASFVGEDASGSFGLMARHQRFMTVLAFGLARLLYFVDNELRIFTRRYLSGTDATAIAGTLAQQMLAEEQALAATRQKLHRLEAEMLQHMAQLELD